MASPDEAALRSELRAAAEAPTGSDVVRGLQALVFRRFSIETAPYVQGGASPLGGGVLLDLDAIEREGKLVFSMLQRTGVPMRRPREVVDGPCALVGDGWVASLEQGAPRGAKIAYVVWLLQDSVWLFGRDMQSVHRYQLRQEDRTR